jgi:hypothetical protein
MNGEITKAMRISRQILKDQKQLENIEYEDVSKIFRTGAAIYTAALVARSTDTR